MVEMEGRVEPEEPAALVATAPTALAIREAQERGELAGPAELAETAELAVRAETVETAVMGPISSSATPKTVVPAISLPMQVTEKRAMGLRQASREYEGMAAQAAMVVLAVVQRFAQIRDGAERLVQRVQTVPPVVPVPPAPMGLTAPTRAA